MSAIEWTDVTWNPVRGCSRVSEGCRNCYAERMAARFSGPGKPFQGFAEMRYHETATDLVGRPRWTGRVELIPEKLDEPLHWSKPRRVFVNSMSDLFHEALPDEAIDRVFAVMALAGRYVFQVLTKRPERMRRYIESRSRSAEYWKRAVPCGWTLNSYRGLKMIPFPLPNVWLGVSCEDQKTVDERIPLLLQTPAAVRFVSLEPLLGPIGFSNGPLDPENSTMGEWSNLDALDWVIVGGESGPGARSCDVAWIRSIVGQCREAGVPCFVKQLGRRCFAHPGHDDEVRFARHPKNGDPAEWPMDLRVREFPA